jgi:hypothetical protein
MHQQEHFITLTIWFSSRLVTSLLFKLSLLPLSKSSSAAPLVSAANSFPDQESEWSPETCLTAPTAFECTLVSDGTAFADGEGDDLFAPGLLEVDWVGDKVIFEDDEKGIEPEGGVLTVDARVQ